MSVAVTCRTLGIIRHTVHYTCSNTHLVKLPIDYILVFESIPGIKDHLRIFCINPPVGDCMGNRAGKQGCTGSLVVRLLVKHIHPHTVAALTWTKSVYLPLEIAKNPFEIL